MQCSPKKKPPVKAASSEPATWSVLLELGRDRLELRVQGCTDRIDRRDDHNRNAGGDQTIFDGGSARLVFEERKKGMHLR